MKKNIDDYIDCMLVNKKHVNIIENKLICGAIEFECAHLAGVPDGSYWSVVFMEQGCWILAIVSKAGNKHVISAGKIT